MFDGWVIFRLLGKGFGLGEPYELLGFWTYDDPWSMIEDWGMDD